MKNNNYNKIKKNNNVLYKKNKKQNNKIISILGINSNIKIQTTLIIANMIKNKKILIINMDFLNNIFEKEYLNKLNKKIIKINSKKYIKINNNIYYIDGREIIFKEKNIINFLNSVKEKYDYLIINTSYECFLNYNKKLIKNSNINYFIIKKENAEYKKCINLIKIYKKQWKIPDKKIKILINSKKEEFNE